MTSNVEVVRTKFAEAHPDIVAAYVKALDKSVSMYKNDESTAIKTIAEAMELTEDNAKFQMSGSTWLTGSEQIQRILEQAVQRVLWYRTFTTRQNF